MYMPNQLIGIQTVYMKDLEDHAGHCLLSETSSEFGSSPCKEQGNIGELLIEFEEPHGKL